MTAYPSYVISSNESPLCPEPFFIALSIVSLGTLFLLALDIANRSLELLDF